MNPREFTVLLLVPDYAAENFGQDVVLYHVATISPKQAIIWAQDRAKEKYNFKLEPAEDFHPLLVMKGFVKDCRYPGPSKKKR
jgi:hypothetical protein